MSVGCQYLLDRNTNFAARYISEHLLEVGCEDTGWIDLAQDWNRWRAIVKDVMNFWVP
jgi:hypothetical protein